MIIFSGPHDSGFALPSFGNVFLYLSLSLQPCRPLIQRETNEYHALLCPAPRNPSHLVKANINCSHAANEIMVATSGFINAKK